MAMEGIWRRTCFATQIVGEEATMGFSERPEAQYVPPLAGLENVAPFLMGETLAAPISGTEAWESVVCFVASQRSSKLPIRVHGPVTALQCYVGLCRWPRSILSSCQKQWRWKRGGRAWR